MVKESSASKQELSIEVKVTGECNHGCFHCMNNDGRRARLLDAKRFAEQVAALAEPNDLPFTVKEVRMTGGEPLCAIDSVLKIAAACSKAGIASGINTNGSLLTPENALRLRKAGLRTIKISFDAVDENIFRKIRGSQASLAPTLEGIANAVANGFFVVTRFTLCAFNESQLVPCYKKASALGVQQFQVKPLISSGRALRSNAFLPEKRVRGALALLAEAARGNATTKPQVQCFAPEKTSGLKTTPCASLNKVYVSSEGMVSLCNYLPSDAPFANLSNESLASALKRRQARTETAGGCEILAGCPQAKYF